MTAPDTGIDVLDCRFPIEWTLQSRIWQDAIRGWDGRAGFVGEEVARATEYDTQRKIFPERHFVQAEVDTVTLRAIEPGAGWDMPGGDAHWYRQAQEELGAAQLEVAHETAVGAEVAVWHEPEPVRPHWWDRFTASGGA